MLGIIRTPNRRKSLDNISSPESSHNARRQHDQVHSEALQERSLGLTLIAISILFIICQSVKMVPRLHEMFCDTFQAGTGQNERNFGDGGQQKTTICKTTNVIEHMIRYSVNGAH